MKLWIINHSCEYEVRHLIGMFFPGEKLEVLTEEYNPDEEGILTEIILHEYAQSVVVNICWKGEKSSKQVDELPLQMTKQESEAVFGRMLYELLSEVTKIYPPWGILTGVRPEKFVQEAHTLGLTDEEIKIRFHEKFFLAEEKIDLLLKTSKGQKRALNHYPAGGIDLYVGIPFCPSRCLYCSFVSHDTAKAGKLIPEY